MELINEIEYATYKLDSNLRIIQVDKHFTKLTGYTQKDIKEKEIFQVDLIFEEDREHYFAMVQRNLEKKGEAFIEHRIQCKDGTERFVFCLGQATVDEDGTPVSVIRAMDVTHLIYMRLQAAKIRKENDDEVEEWMKLANTDELTGVLRRGGFLPTIEKLVEKNSDYTLMIIDVDDFKDVNDLCGHAVGDEVLRAVAHVLQKVVRDKDLVCRMGGDEFAVFLQKMGKVETAKHIAERILCDINKLQEITEGKVPIHVSIGCVVHNDESDFDLKKMFREADDALYEAKERGKNRCIIR